MTLEDEYRRAQQEHSDPKRAFGNEQSGSAPAHAAVSGNANGGPYRPQPPTQSVGQILETLVTYLRRFVAFSEAGQAEAIALWVVHTWLFASVQPDTTMYLGITSAEPESGKSRLLEVLELLVADPLYAFNMSPAALCRVIAKQAPTVLFDEVDAVFSRREGNEDVRAILNAGYRKGAQAYRVRDRSMEVDGLAVYCPKALAGIGDLPDTVASRSIPIRLRRRRTGERVEPFYRREVSEQIDPWLQQARSVAIQLPDRAARAEGLGDRASDGWEILFRIADAAGGDWPKCARDSALALHTRKAGQKATQGVQVLRDLRTIFDAIGDTGVATEILIHRLCEIEESPWADWYGKRFTAQALARLLRPYGVQPKHWRAERVGTVRGYLRGDLEDPWSRYLTDSVSSPSATTDTTGTASVVVPDVADVPELEKTSSASSTALVDVGSAASESWTLALFPEDL